MKLKVTKRRAGVGLLTLALLIAGVGTAVAYWSNSGGGTGTVNVASSGSWFSIGSTVPTASLYPGSSVTVSYTVTNNDTAAHYLHDVTVNAASSATGCTAALAALSINSSPVTGTSGPVTVASPPSPVQVAASGGTYTGTFTLSMADTTSDQSACEGAPISLTYSTN